MATRVQLSIVDYVILGVLLLMSSAIGVYFRFSGRNKRTTKDYLLGNQEMGIFPVACSLTASLLSAITILGTPTEIYHFGLRYTLLNVGFLIATPILAHLFLPIYHSLGNISMYQYLTIRFGNLTKLFVSSVFILQTLFYLAIVLYAPALALASVVEMSISTCIVVVGVVTTFYSTIGGMKAVLFTDVLQMLVIYGSIITVATLGTKEMGGVSEVIHAAKIGQRLEVFDFRVNPTITYSFWSLVIGGAFSFLSQNAVSQTQIQRLLSIGSIRKSQAAIYFQWLIAVFVNLILAYIGLIFYFNYKDCDPVENEEISQNDQLYPFFVIQTLSKYPGVAGLAFSGILSGSLSSLSSCFNSLAAVVIQDYIRPIIKAPLSDGRAYIFSQITVIICGAITIGLTFTIMEVGGIVKASQLILGALGGPILGIFIMGLVIPFGNQLGCIIGSILSISFGLFMTFVNERIDKGFAVSIEGCTNVTSSDMNQRVLEVESGGTFLNISSLWISPLATIIVFVIGSLVSYITRSRNGPISPTTVLPFVRKYLLTHESNTDVEELDPKDVFKLT